MVQFKPFAALATDFHHRIDDMPMLAADESPPEHKSGALADFRCAELDLHRLEQFRPAIHARFDLLANGLHAQGPSMASFSANTSYCHDSSVVRLPLTQNWRPVTLAAASVHSHATVGDTFFRRQAYRGLFAFRHQIFGHSR